MVIKLLEIKNVHMCVMCSYTHTCFRGEGGRGKEEGVRNY